LPLATAKGYIDVSLLDEKRPPPPTKRLKQQTNKQTNKKPIKQEEKEEKRRKLKSCPTLLWPRYKIRAWGLKGLKLRATHTSTFFFSLFFRRIFYIVCIRIEREREKGMTVMTKR
jgi:hypothetical protein